jgi:hypothetical protein
MAHTHTWTPLDLFYGPDATLTWTRQRCTVCGKESPNVLGRGESVSIEIDTQ